MLERTLRRKRRGRVVLRGPLPNRVDAPIPPGYRSVPLVGCYAVCGQYAHLTHTWRQAAVFRRAPRHIHTDNRKAPVVKLQDIWRTAHTNGVAEFFRGFPQPPNFLHLITTYHTTNGFKYSKYRRFHIKRYLIR